MLAFWHTGFAFVLILACIFYVITVHIPFQCRCGASLRVLLCWDKEISSRNGILSHGSLILGMKMSTSVLKIFWFIQTCRVSDNINVCFMLDLCFLKTVTLLYQSKNGMGHIDKIYLFWSIYRLSQIKLWDEWHETKRVQSVLV